MKKFIRQFGVGTMMALAVISSKAAFAGDKGNGGYSIVCRDSANKITSAELLDVFEGR
jgi:hypothetical protein